MAKTSEENSKKFHSFQRQYYPTFHQKRFFSI